MTYVIIVLVCGALPCDRASADFTFEVAEPAASPQACLLLGQAAAARSGLVREGDFVAIRCVPGERA